MSIQLTHRVSELEKAVKEQAQALAALAQQVAALKTLKLPKKAE